ncbi:MAG: NUDIX hydrolase [Anaerolineae bacterium]|jgi:8-oxo-dGTP pyrophosphatase MutT (NUDIX family)
MISFQKNGVRFGHRTVAVLIDGGRVLLQYDEVGDYWFLTGGRVEMHEDSKQALMREMQEELGFDVQIERLLWAVENFVENNGVLHHGAELYYLASLPEDATLRTTTDPIYCQDNGVRLIFQWIPLDKLDEITLYPVFLKTGLRNLPRTTEHIVIHQ